MSESEDSIKKESLGSYLRKKRTEKGFSLEQISSDTKIHVRLLQALEEDDQKNYPAKPFLRGFIQSYARALGLDPYQVLHDFQFQLEESATSEEQSHEYIDQQKTEKTKVFYWLTISVFGVASLLGYFLLQPNFQSKRWTLQKIESEKRKAFFEKKDQEKITPSQEEKKPDPSPAENVSKNEALEKTKAPEEKPTNSAEVEKKEDDPIHSGRDLSAGETKVKFLFRAFDQVTVRYQVDDKPIMQFILKKGLLLALKAKERIIFQTSQPERLGFNPNQSGYRNIESSPYIVKKSSQTFLIYPIENKEEISKSWSEKPPLDSLQPAE